MLTRGRALSLSSGRLLAHLQSGYGARWSGRLRCPALSCVAGRGQATTVHVLQSPAGGLGNPGPGWTCGAPGEGAWPVEGRAGFYPK